MSNMQEEFFAAFKEQIVLGIAKLTNVRDEWVARYPVLIAQIHHYYKPQLERLQENLELVESGVVPSVVKVDIKQSKSDYWEFLQIVGTCDPDLPIVDMHDDYCTMLDEGEAQFQRESERMKALAEEYVHVRYDVRLLTGLGRPDEAAEVQEEFLKRHGAK